MITVETGWNFPYQCLILVNYFICKIGFCCVDPQQSDCSCILSCCCRCFFCLFVPPRCQNTGDLSWPYRHSLRSEVLLCVALTLNPVNIYQCLLLVAQTGFSTEAMGVHDYTLACLCLLGTLSLLTSAAVNCTQR